MSITRVYCLQPETGNRKLYNYALVDQKIVYYQTTEQVGAGGTGEVYRC